MFAVVKTAFRGIEEGSRGILVEGLLGLTQGALTMAFAVTV